MPAPDEMGNYEWQHTQPLTAFFATDQHVTNYLVKCVRLLWDGSEDSDELMRQNLDPIEYAIFKDRIISMERTP